MKLTHPHQTLRFLSGALALAGLLATAGAQTTVRASVATGGTQANGESPLVGAKISGNNRYVVFRSTATNLVPGDTNGVADIFRRDLVSGQTIRVSLADDESQALNGDSNNPSVSADGRFVAFSSFADNLAGADTNGFSDVFVRDILLGTTTKVSVGPGGIEGDGHSDSSGIWAVSENDLKVVYRSSATNLTGSATSGSQVFVWSNLMGAASNLLVSVAPDGVTQGSGSSGYTQNSISADGNVVGFSSSAPNLVASDTNGTVLDSFTRNLSTGTTLLISKATNGLQGMNGSSSSALSNNGRYVAFISQNNFVNGDTNAKIDVFVRDTVANTTIRASVDSAGKQGNNDSGKSNGWGVSISGDGSKVLFQSLATNLVKGDTNGFEDIFLRNLSTNTTTMVSVTPANKAPNGSSGGLNTCGVSISADGLYSMFASYASNVVSGDTNGVMDVFVRGPVR